MFVYFLLKTFVMKRTTQSKKDVQEFIKKELILILIKLNPKMGKKEFKRNLKKAGKVLYRIARKSKVSKDPIEITSKLN